MYSKNDYRYYLEHRLAESDDYLAHYGVKGMKWKNRKDSSYRMESTLLTGSGLSRTIADIGVNNYKQKQAKTISNNVANAISIGSGKTVKSTSNYSKKKESLKKVNDDNQRGQNRTKQFKKKKAKKRFKNPLAPKNQKVTVESFKDRKTGIDYKK